MRFWDRAGLINLILFGKYAALRNAVLEEFGSVVPGRSLQISCCYGALTPRLAERVKRGGGELTVIDVLPVQLENLQGKLSPAASVRTLCMNAAELDLPDASFDHVLVFFLLHEQPQDYRERTMREALRVLKPSGKIIVADYGRPSRWNPLRYLLLPFLGLVEPSARALWRCELADILPRQFGTLSWSKTSYFGGLYQVLVHTCAATG